MLLNVKNEYGQFEVSELSKLIINRLDASDYDVEHIDEIQRSLENTWRFLAILVEILLWNNIFDEQDVVKLLHHYSITDVEVLTGKIDDRA